MATHELKTEAVWFRAMGNCVGEKNFEIRKYDRPFQAGDRVVFIEIVYNDADAPVETGFMREATITYVLPEILFRDGICHKYCVFGLTDISAPTS